jgi:hypothetical protein
LQKKRDQGGTISTKILKDGTTFFVVKIGKKEAINLLLKIKDLLMNLLFLIIFMTLLYIKVMLGFFKKKSLLLDLT